MSRFLFVQLLPTMQKFLPYLIFDRFFFLGVGVAILLMAVTNTLLIWLLGMPIDLLAQQHFENFTAILLVILAVVVMNQLFLLLSIIGSNWLGLRFVGRVRQALLGTMLNVQTRVTTALKKGDLLARFSHDVDQVQRLMVEMPVLLISHVATAGFYGAMLWWIHWQMALLVLGIFPIFMVHQRFFGQRKHLAAAGFFQRNGELLSHEDDTLNNLQGIQAFCAEKHVLQSHCQRFKQAFIWAMRERWLDVFFNASLSLLIYGGGVAIVFMGMLAIQNQSISLAELVSFLLFLGYLSVPMRGLAEMPFQAQADMAAANRLNEVLQIPVDVNTAQSLKPLVIKHGSIEVQALCFRYASSGDWLFKEVKFSIEGGQTVAIVGPSGVGKTTLAKLLLGFEKPQQGRILIDHQDIHDVAVNTLREQIAVVWQGPVLTTNTVRENLLLANASATDALLVDACQQSGAWDFMAHWPAGLETVIGAAGQMMSAGEMQRLAIAQVFLRDPKILILDEASSALDSHTEQQLVSVLAQLRKDRTILIIAHRYSSIRSADAIIYLNNDGSVDMGLHDELMQHHVGYREAVMWQYGVRDDHEIT